ncbi:MAG: hypothetical protein G8345_02725 [Magnetococcales bacterium]|nr:hypothetical protein [Magnetococcales bacterium]NGZ25786.1 hypothetical protein [Magnetococcales bacterium]
MDSIEVAKIKPGQSLTLTFGEKEVTLTRLDEPGKFNAEGWFEEEQEIYLLDENIEEDELLHYSLTPMPDPVRAIQLDKDRFGINKVVYNFLNRPVEGIEMDEEEEEDDEAGDDEEEEEG